jgi:hypothetical protein
MLPVLLALKGKREGPDMSGVGASRVSRLATKRGPSGPERSDESGET